jgi:hypothetical protein
VWVAGVIRVEFEDDALYVSREHYRADLREYAVGLGFDEDALGANRQELSRLNGHYVLVEGLFAAPPVGFDLASGPNGSIHAITQVRPIQWR